MKFIKTKEQKTKLLLLAALFVSGLCIYWRYIFGGDLPVFNDSGNDTWQQYTMHYQTIVNHIRRGSFSWWDFTNGFGTNMFNLNLFDPSLILLYLLGVITGPEHMVYYLVWIQLGRILLAGAAMYHLLGYYGISERAKFLAAYIYGLNGFLIVWGQHYQFGMITVYVPVLLFLLERSLQKKKITPLFPLMVCATAVYSTYLAYMSMILVGCYLIVRLLMMEQERVKTKIRLFLSSCGSILLGVGMSLAILMPTAAVIFGVSSRLESETSLVSRILGGLAPYPSVYYGTLLDRFFSSNLRGMAVENVSGYAGYLNYYEDPVVFTSTLFVILGVQYLFILWRTKLSTRRKVLGYVTAVVIGLALLLPLGGIVFNGFTQPFSRYTFLFIPVFTILIAWMLDWLMETGKISYVGLALTTLLMIKVYHLGYDRSFFVGHKTNASILAMTGEIMVAVVLCMALVRRVSFRKGLYGLLALAVMVNMVSEGNACFVDRVSLKKGDPEYFGELYSRDIQQALNYVRATDPEFCRVEKAYVGATACMDSLAQEYRGISTYNSTMNGNLKDFVQTCYPGLMYSDTNHYQFAKVAEDSEFAAFCGVRYVLSKDAGMSQYGYKLVKRFGDIRLYKNTKPAYIGTVQTVSISEESFRKLCDGENSVDILNRAIVLENGQNYDRAEKIPEDENESRIFLNSPKKESEISGWVTSEKNGYAVFKIPYENGWKIYLDGEEQEIEKADLGFLGIKVPAGSHRLQLEFSPPLLKQGLKLSAVFWVLYLLFLLQFYYDRRKANQN